MDRGYVVIGSILLVLVWVGVAAYADMRFKAAAGSFRSWNFLIGLLCYALTGFLAVATLKRHQWGWTMLMWTCVSLGVNMLLSVVVFHEPFTLRRAIATVLVLAVAFLSE